MSLTVVMTEKLLLIMEKFKRHFISTMKQSLLLVVSSVFYLFGCSTLTVSQPSSRLVSQVEAPLKSDVKVGQKISGTAQAIQLFGLFEFGPKKSADGVNYRSGGLPSLFDSFSAIQAAAAHQAVTNTNADVIVAPRYTIDTKDYLLFKTTTATVTGYKGVLNKVKKSNPAANKTAQVSASKQTLSSVPVPEQKIMYKKDAYTQLELNKKASLNDDSSRQVMQKEVITKDELVIDNGIAYIANDYKPFTGKHSKDHPYVKKNDVVGATGKKEPDTTKSQTKTYIEVSYTDGKKNGPSIIWDEHGRKIGQLNYKNGKRID